jgi:hypothetical protein
VMHSELPQLGCVEDADPDVGLVDG